MPSQSLYETPASLIEHSVALSEVLRLCSQSNAVRKDAFLTVTTVVAALLVQQSISAAFDKVNDNGSGRVAGAGISRCITRLMSENNYDAPFNNE